MRAPGVVLGRVALVLGGLLVGLGLAELALRRVDPEATYGTARELVDFREGGRRLAREFVADPQLGFRPVLGRGAYTRTGTLANAYPIERRPGVPRLLFVGDSATARGQIVAGLARRGGDRFEYWNAGVEGYNTVQEVAFYERYNAAIRPNHVILTFHNNDFEVTPVAFLDGEGRLVVYAPSSVMTGPGRWLFARSLVYRLVVGAAASVRRDRARIVEETRRSLARLRDRLADEHVRLTVVLLPILRPYARWTELERASRRDSLRLFQELGLETVDLFPALEDALAATPAGDQDAWHPAPAAADRFAAYIAARGVLGILPERPPPDGGGAGPATARIHPE